MVQKFFIRYARKKWCSSCNRYSISFFIRDYLVPPVLSPPAPITTTVVDLILQSPDHTTLAQALQVQAADLITTLQSSPFTVFAPTNRALIAYLTTNNLNLDDLLKSPNLGDILKYHVLSSKVMALDIMNYNNVPVRTVQGENLSITGGSSVTINDANVIQANMEADNGVVHVINALLIPPSMITPASPPPTASPAPPAPPTASPAPPPTASPAPTPNTTAQHSFTITGYGGKHAHPHYTWTVVDSFGTNYSIIVVF